MILIRKLIVIKHSKSFKNIHNDCFMGFFLLESKQYTTQKQRKNRNKMSLKIKFERLDYQEKAVNSISNVFKNIAFEPNINAKSNPSFDLNQTKPILAENIKEVRNVNSVTVGDVSIKDELVLDTLMETGTGKTFTFLESIYRLNRDYGLSKFIILVPSKRGTDYQRA